MSEVLPYDAAGVWLAAFLRAATTKKRFSRISELPTRLSSGWRRTIVNARIQAETDGQTSVVKRLEGRLSKADGITDDGTRKSYLCPGCGETHVQARFGVRRMDRKAPVDDDGNAVLQPHWHVLTVSDNIVRGRRAVKIQVRQSQCRACRNLLTAGVKWSPKKTDADGLGPNGSIYEIAPIPPDEEQRAEFWERWEARQK